MKVTHKELADALFEDTYPTCLIRPFTKQESRGPLRKFSLQVELRPWTERLLYAPVSRKHVFFLSQVSGIPIDALFGLPGQIIYRLLENHAYESTKWLREAANLLPEYVKAPDSQIEWATLSSLGKDQNFSSPSYLQKLWISLNMQQDRVANFQVWGSMFDSLSMWVNPEMYFKAQDYEESRRQNIMYEQAHERMMQGLPPLGVTDENLDIVVV